MFENAYWLQMAEINVRPWYDPRGTELKAWCWTLINLRHGEKQSDDHIWRV